MARPPSLKLRRTKAGKDNQERFIGWASLREAKIATENTEDTELWHSVIKVDLIKSVEGVTFLKDEIAKRPGRFETLLEIVIAHARKNEKKVPWSVAKNQLKKAGKL